MRLIDENGEQKGVLPTPDALRLAREQGLDLVAQIDADDDPQRAVEAGAEVAVDFTHPGVTMQNIEFCVRNGIDVVVGTSGFADERLAEVRSWADKATGVRVLIAPNFSVGAVLMMRFAAQAARFFESAEIIELHHANKMDAPSGTALRTAAMMGEARTRAGLGSPPDATKQEVKAAVELLFKVEVNSVNVLVTKGKAKRFGRFNGKRKDVKKAYVCLKPGQEINFEAEAK